MFRTGQETLGEVRNGSVEALEGPGRFRYPQVGSGMVWRHSGRSGTGRGTHPEVLEGSGTFGQVLDGLGDPQAGPRWVGGPSVRFGNGRGTLRQVRDG